MADNFTPEQLDTLNSFFNRIQSGNQAMDPYVRATQDATIAQQRYMLAVNSSKNALTSFTQAIISPTTGVEKFGLSISQAGETVVQLTKYLGAAGPVLGKVLTAFTKVTELGIAIGVEGLKRQDALARSFENLSEISAIATGGLEGLKDSLNYIGLTTLEGEKLVQVLRPVTKELSNFGGSVTSGTQKLLDVFKGFVGPDSFERSLMNIGYTSDTIRDSVANYVGLQTRLGLSQTRSVAELQQSSYKYLTTLKELQELTGLSRDEMQREREMQLSDARFRIYLQGLNEKERETMQNAMLTFRQKFGPEAASGLMDLIVNQGRITTEQAAKLQQIAPDAYKLMMDVVQTEGKPEDIAKLLQGTASNVKDFMGTFRETIMLSNEALIDMGAANKMLNGAIEINATDFSKLTQTTKDLLDASKKEEGLLADRITLEQQLRKVRLEADTAFFEVAKRFTSALAWVADYLEGFVRVILKSTTDLANAMGFQVDFTTRQSDQTGGYRRGTGFGSDTGMFPGSSEMSANEIGRPVDQAELATRQQRAAELSTRAAGRKMEILNKLKFKKGATSGGEADPALLALAEKINEKFADLGGIEITAMDDMYHRIKRPNSAHVRGKAMDFTIPGGDKLAPEETRRIKEWLKSQGASKVLDEYNDDYNPKDSTGKHFHVEVAKMGGFFKGNNSGYPVMLHGNESVWPEGKLGNLLKDVQKLSIDQYKDEIMNKLENSSITGTPMNPTVDTGQLITMLSDKLDDVLDILEKSYNTQDELLNYSKV